MRNVALALGVVSILSVGVTRDATAVEGGNEDVSCQWQTVTNAEGVGTFHMAFDPLSNCELVIDELLLNLQVSNGASLGNLRRDTSVPDTCVVDVGVKNAPPHSMIDGCLPSDLADALTPGAEQKEQRRGFWLPAGLLGLLALGGDDDDGIQGGGTGIEGTPDGGGGGVAGGGAIPGVSGGVVGSPGL
ncbi:MAG: hypothetical protein ACREQJ_10075 [Candidatus Binatia bacterium]